MELSATTFILEVINFLVLVWILKHFLYRPVLEVIAKRRNAIAERLDSARRLRDEAESMKTQYEGRLATWESEKQAAREALREELSSQRDRLQAMLNAELQQEREKAAAIEQRERDTARRRDEEQALHIGAAFASRLLRALAGPELEQRLISLAEASLKHLPAEDFQAIGRAWKPGESEAVVTTAYPLSAEIRLHLQTTLSSELSLEKPRWKFAVDPALVAGVRIEIGPKILRASLQDELALLVEVGDVYG